MSNRIQALAQQITGKKNIDDCSIDELQHMAKRHPYYAPAQFLLLQKLRQSGTPEQAEAQYRKAVLFYHDPLLFEHFISANKFFVEEISVANDSLINPDAIEIDTQEEDTLIEESNEIAPAIISQPLEVSDVRDDAETSYEEEEPSVIDLPQQNEVPVTEEPGEFEIVGEPDHLEPDVSEEVPAIPEEEPDVIQTKEEFPSEHESSQPAANLREEKPATTELAFEPFHTVDYFASQGIKITNDEAPKDKLGKQLKSFTEWLKTMKRLPASQITATAETSAEKKVETLASHSVSESDVVTEAMAEVWLKQGNIEKALDIYNKLSLLNPSKKAYFAAKIENLKQS